MIGCRCSGASIAVARIAGLEQVPQVSMGSTSKKLSDKEEFPFFSRVTSSLEANALISLLRHFDWDRVTILRTDTQYASDLSTEFERLWIGDHSDDTGAWTGSVPYSHTIVINENDEVNADSIRQALEGAPTGDPTVNSRIVLLIAHDQHAYHILKQANEMDFQKDTVWVGTGAWTNRLPADASGLEAGYIGITPYRNRDGIYTNYLGRLQKWQQGQGRDPWPELPDYAAEYLVDSILVAALALSAVETEDRMNGALVTEALRDVSISGISGYLRLDSRGDRAEPKFSVFNLQAVGPNEALEWIDVGVASTYLSQTEADLRDFCFADVGCNLFAAPLDSYPVPGQPVSKAVTIAIPIILALFSLVLWRYCRSKAKKRRLKSTMTEMQKRVEAMKEIDNDLLNIDEMVEAAKKRQAELIERRAALQDVPDTWSNDIRTLVEVPPDDEQYWSVLERMRSTMPDVYISKLWRVQNTSLWTYYSFHKERLSMHKITHGERSVWHGTSGLDPSVIYDDQQDGFMMQFAAQGYWGRGIYFAENAAYSNAYAYRANSPTAPPSIGDGGRSAGDRDEREMFLTKLLVGNDIFMDRDESSDKALVCSRLTVPPTDTRTGLKYNTVSGKTGGSKVYVVYENGRAYPDYLVRYYMGRRDSKRSPFETKEEALKIPSPPSAPLGAPEDDSAVALSAFTWEYEDDDGWKSYSMVHQEALEAHHQAWKTNKVRTTMVYIQSDTWSYTVDVESMVQTNTEHANHRQRAVRRRLIPTSPICNV